MPRIPDDTTLRPGQRLTDGANFDTRIERVEYGGFGVIALGSNILRDGQMTAYRTLRRELLDDPTTRASFVRECLLWQGLWPHPNVTSAYATIEMNDEAGARPFLALEYAENGSLRNLLFYPARRESGRLPLDVALNLAQQIAAGLVYLHQPDPAYLRYEPIVHRDLKPENVLLMSDGRAAITDFGLAKAVGDSPTALALLLSSQSPSAADWQGDEEAIILEGEEAIVSPEPRLHTAQGIALGTLAYMPPEQWEDARSVGLPADIYAMGIMLSELVAGRHALIDLNEPHSQAEWRRAHDRPQPRPLRDVAPEAPVEIEAIYQRCLARDPADRPSASELLATLQASAQTIGVEVYEPYDMVPHTPYNELAYWHTTALASLTFQFYPEALSRVDRALEIKQAISGNLDASNWEVLLTKGTILVAQGLQAHESGNETEAKSLFDRAFQLYYIALDEIPDHNHRGKKAVWANIGSCLSIMGNYSDADTAFQRAIDALPDADLYLQRALNYRYWTVSALERGQVDDAKRLLVNGKVSAVTAIGMGVTGPTANHLFDALRQFESSRLGATDSAP